ncbi:MAG: myo-inosose-2 dehydratase, partial [bacterium]
MSVQLAVAPIAWSNSDLPQLGGDTPLETCLRESREAGFTGTESGANYTKDPEKLGPLLKQFD